jgi:hypothetical protein
MSIAKTLAAHLAALVCVGLGKLVLGAVLLSAACAYLVICAGHALEAVATELEGRA